MSLNTPSPMIDRDPEDRAVYQAMLRAHTRVHGEPDQNHKRYLWQLARGTREELELYRVHDLPRRPGQEASFREAQSLKSITDGARIGGGGYIVRMVTPWLDRKLPPVG